MPSLPVLILPSIILLGVVSVMPSPALELDPGPDLNEPNAGAGMEYIFQRGEKGNPGHATSLLKASIDGLPRPLYLAGFNQSGRITAALEDADGLEALASAGGLVDFGELIGAASTVFSVYPPATDVQNHVGRHLFAQDNPEIGLHILELNNLIKPHDGDDKDGSEEFSAEISGQFTINDVDYPFTAPARVILREASAKGESGRPPMMQLIMTWSMPGSDFGWTGKQAEDVEFRLHKQGFGDTRKESNRMFDDALRDHLLHD